LTIYRVCPVCRSEYTQLATRCIDCDVELVAADALPPEADQEREAFPPASELDCVRVAPIEWIRALSRALEQGGVPHRVEPTAAENAPEGQRPDVFGEAQLFGLYVQSEQAPMARELDATIAARLLPEEAPALAPDEQEECPACGTALTPDAIECPDCGLRFG
jgi:hypothetical protein